jgi:hypothetical protein
MKLIDYALNLKKADSSCREVTAAGTPSRAIRHPASNRHSLAHLLPLFKRAPDFVQRVRSLATRPSVLVRSPCEGPATP